MATAALDWSGAHDGSPVHHGYDGAYLVAQVAFYDHVAGGAPGWVGYVIGHRITGRCQTAELAMRLVDERATAKLAELDVDRPRNARNAPTR